MTGDLCLTLSYGTHLWSLAWGKEYGLKGKVVVKTMCVCWVFRTGRTLEGKSGQIENVIPKQISKIQWTYAKLRLFPQS